MSYHIRASSQIPESNSMIFIRTNKILKFIRSLKLYSLWNPGLYGNNVHSQKQSAHWAVDVTAQMVPCWLGSWLNRNFWLVLGQRTQLAFQFIQLDITWTHCLYAADSGNTQLSGWKISWVTCIWTPESSLHLISPLNCISTEPWLRWWYTVGWAVSSESVLALEWESWNFHGSHIFLESGGQ